MTEIHLVLPAGYDDPHRPSGGNVYDHRVSTGLTELGWTVIVQANRAANDDPAGVIDAAAEATAPAAPTEATAHALR